MTNLRSQSLNIASFPPETLTRIFSFLPPPCVNIQAVLRTCKSFYDVALPLSVGIFRTTDEDDEDYGDDEDEEEGEDENEDEDESSNEDDGDDGSKTDRGNKAKQKRNPRAFRSLAFLRYITITKPAMCDFVHSVIVGSYSTAESIADAGDEDRSPKLSPTERQAYEGIIHRCVSKHDTKDWQTWREEWLEDLDNGIEDAYIALILAVCPNVNVFCFGDPEEPRNVPRIAQIAAERSQRSTKSSGLLQSLAEIYYESADNKYGGSLFDKTTAPFLKLPSIRSWECVLVSAADNSAQALWEPSSSAIQHLTIRKASMTTSSMRTVTRACRALRSFEFSRGIYHMYDLEMMPRDIMDTLLPHASTLETLYINYEEDWQKVGWEDEPDALYFGHNLNKMVALRTLTTSMQSLTGLLDGQPIEIFSDEMPLEVQGAPRLVECLPPNLEFLEVHGCGKAILEQAQELVSAIENGEFQKLAHVRLLFNAEKIKRDEIQLATDATQLEVVLQTPEHRKYDLCPSYDMPGVEGAWADNMCTRIYDPTMQCRDLWLATRGSDKGEADENSAVTSIKLE